MAQVNWEREEVEANGLLLGHFPEESYPVVQLPVEPGDRVILYTDGIMEAGNPSNEMFGVDRIRRLLETNYALGTSEFIDALIDELSRWSGQPGGQGQQDDITILAVHFKSDKWPINE